jgi:Tol biopolymer transport system component
MRTPAGCVPQLHWHEMAGFGQANPALYVGGESISVKNENIALCSSVVLQTPMISELCIYDLATGIVRVVLDDERILEAPNWHPKGFLVVNSAGLLYRVPLDAPRLELINTGFATKLNNDHGFSPDGETLAISDKTRTEGSCIYVLPIEGGDPVRVTENVPSWWHGWSPDGCSICYPAARGSKCKISLFTMRMCDGGGAEVCVTDDFDHVDGPDYSADGRWIWFNGERDAAVDIWRIRPDGTDLQRMTDDSLVNWFPHPSPCGHHVVYLAYPSGTTGHPRGVDVALRLMPQAGGASREIVTLWGGQGSINVPSWAPDGSAFAFVRFRR